jgi:hypothetical protein
MTNRNDKANDQAKQEQPATDIKSRAKLDSPDLMSNTRQPAQNDQANADQPGQTITQQIDAATGEPVQNGRLQQDRNI